MTADIFDLPVYRPHTPETSVVGAAMDAAVGMGIYADIEEAAQHMTGRPKCSSRSPRTGSCTASCTRACTQDLRTVAALVQGDSADHGVSEVVGVAVADRDGEVGPQLLWRWTCVWRWAGSAGGWARMPQTWLSGRMRIAAPISAAALCAGLLAAPPAQAAPVPDNGSAVATLPACAQAALRGGAGPRVQLRRIA